MAKNWLEIKRASGSSVTFKSDIVGEVTVDWSKVQAVHSTRSFAMIPRNVTFKRHAATTSIPEGTLSLTDQKLTVTPAAGVPQESRTFSGAISLVRIEPSEDWLTRRDRTTFDFSGSYGTI